MTWDLVRKVISVSTLATLSACWGGGSGDTASSGGTGGTGVSAVSVGVMTKGSVIVNGVEFDDTTAAVTVDDTGGTRDDLADGMVVTVRGRINDDRVTGTAERVEVENEVRGTIESKNSTALPPSFVVVGQMVLVDDLTVYANFTPPPVSPSAAVDALSVGTDVVEVHGLRDSTGNIRASRIEKVTPGAKLDEVRGTIKPGTLVAGTGFTLQNGATEIAVTYNSATTISPAAVSLAEGAFVEIHGSYSAGTFAAAKIDLEEVEDDMFGPTASDDVELDGFVVGFTAHPGTFTINGQTVETTANTRFRNGSALDLANDIEVEAEGHLSGSTLVAEKIEFRRTRVVLVGTAGAVTGTITSGTGNTGTITLLGNAVQVNSLTRVDTGDSIAAADRVEIEGFVDTMGAIVAERIKDNAGGGSAAIIQSQVAAKAGNVLTILGIGADLTSATQFRGVDDQPLGGLTEFLAAVTPASSGSPGTLVKVKGIYDAISNTIAVDEAELED